MNKEIRDILEIDDNVDYKKLSMDEIVILKDYIEKLIALNISLMKGNEEYSFALDKQIIKNRRAIEHIRQNCITSDIWEEVSPNIFYARGNIKYKSLPSNKVKDLLNILEGKDTDDI